MAKVFLSYSRKDQAFVEELYRRLKRDGVECFFDKQSIQWGDNFVLALEKGIDESDIVVAVLSPDFCKSEWATIERTSAMVEDPAGLRRRLRPLMRKPCRVGIRGDMSASRAAVRVRTSYPISAANPSTAV